MNSEAKNRLGAVLALFVAALLIGAASFAAGRCSGGKEAPEVAVRRDTVRVPVPVSVRDTLLRVDTVHYAVPAGREGDGSVLVRDTLLRVDTVEKAVVLPVTRKTYRDSSYMAVVSGYRPSLDYIETYGTTAVRTETKWLRPRVSLGIGGGCYATPKGLLPGIGVTLQFNVLDFK